ncbi:MAG: 1-acyl-sn-glycerol-3-phosphate acyltransferase [Pseudomonadota bacterium]
MTDSTGDNPGEPAIAEASDRHTVITTKTARVAELAPGKNALISTISHHIAHGWLRAGGWRMVGDWPDLPKAVLLAAPHTSNWDGFNMLAAAGYFRIDLKWMGKKELTTSPLGSLVRAAGCVPVDRDGRHDMVTQMANALKAAKHMILAISPEGTRAKTPGWRSGFYHIAHQAGVPIIFSVLDYGTKTIRISGHLQPSGDYEADLDIIRSHYQTARGKLNDRYTS